MNCRERYVKTLKFEPTDRVPLMEWPVRGATMARWEQEGYPKGMTNQCLFSLDTSAIDAPIHMGMYPSFQEEILSVEGDYKIWRDALGAIRKDFLHDDHPGFVTRSWLSFPVTDRASFLEMTKRYQPCVPERYCAQFDLRADVLNNALVPVHLSIPFLFWVTRDWIGFENLCVMFYDNPQLIEEMFEFLTNFCIENLKPVIDKLDIDIVELKEDMAYKHAPMISPAMFKRYMYPHYVRLISFLKSHGVKLVYVDCDGYPGNELTSLWLDAGVDAVSPCEIAAGNDIIQLRKDFPRLGMFGGIDKRMLARGYAEIEQEVMSKVPWMLERGGYIPHIDHAIPHDVPLKNYMFYRKILTKIVSG